MWFSSVQLSSFPFQNAVFIENRSWLIVGIPKTRGLIYAPWKPLGIPSAVTPICQLYQSPPSPIPGDLGRGPSHQSHVLKHRDTYRQAQVCRKGHQGSSVDRPCQPSFLMDQVLTCTESATSEYSTASQCLSALLGWPLRVRFILNGLRWKKKPTHLSLQYDRCLVTRHPSATTTGGNESHFGTGPSESEEGGDRSASIIFLVFFLVVLSSHS